MTNRDAHLPEGRPVAVWQSGVCERWYKNIWLTSVGQRNPVIAFIDDAPIRYFAAGVDGIPVLRADDFFARYRASGAPFVFVGQHRGMSHEVQVLFERAGLEAGKDFAFFPEAPDYTIDWLAFYSDLADAVADTKGYQDSQLLEEQLDRARKDSIPSKGPPLLSTSDQRLLAGLLPVFMQHQGPLRVVDFGGALGAHFHQVKRILPARQFRWMVCETPAMADIGSKQFRSAELSFYSKIEDVPQPIDLVLISASLQYLDEPELMFDRLSSLGAAYILIDRTPLTPWPEDRLVVQRVFRKTDRSSFESSYFARFFSEAKWMALFQRQYDVVMRWPDMNDVLDIGGIHLIYSGLLLKRR